MLNNSKQKEQELFKLYKNTGNTQYKRDLLKSLDPVIKSQVNKWSGNVPKKVLENKAKILTSKAIDTYDENKNVQLNTHVVNNLAPISRTVYKYQNTARLPENVSLKMSSYNNAKDYLANSYGREPTTDELHQELGWDSNELSRIDYYTRNDLTESVGNIEGSFYGTDDDKEMDALNAIYFDLTPDEKKIFEYSTGYNNKPTLQNDEICKKLGITQAQLSYTKRKMIEKFKKHGK